MVSRSCFDKRRPRLTLRRWCGLSTIAQAAHPQTGINLTYIQQPGQTNILNDGGDIYTGLDRFGRVIDQNWWVVATGTSTDRFQYGYDPASNVLYKNNLVNPNMSELYHANSSARNDNGSAYDPLGRETAFARGILSASGNNPGAAALDTISAATQSQTWAMDALGNWSSSTTNGTAQTRNFNSQNQITGISGTTATPTYDAKEALPEPMAIEQLPVGERAMLERTGTLGAVAAFRKPQPRVPAAAAEA